MRFPTGFFKKEIVKPKRVRIIFDSAPGILTITKSQLRYNKAFAYSFSMDDTLEDSSTVARPLFSGGNIYYQDGIDLNQPGLYYTDGCGNDIPFNGALFLVGSYMVQGVNNFYMGTNEFKKMYAHNWAYVNHSWSHKGVVTDFSNDPIIAAQEMYDEIKNNYDFIKSVSGIKMNYFSAPTAYPPYAEVSPSFLQNKLSFGVMGDEYFNGRTVESCLAANKWNYRRTFVNDDDFTRTAADLTRVSQYLGSLSPTSHPWIHEACHRMNLGEGATTLSANFRYLTAKDYFNRIAATYGKTGSDSIWFANVQDVYEYLRSYEKTVILQNQTGNVIDLIVDFSAVDSDFKNHSLTFEISGGANITSIEYLNFETTSHKITGTSALINVSYKPKYEKSIYNRLNADVRVMDYEAVKTLAFKNTAQTAVTALPNGTYKASLQSRIDAVVLIPDSRTFQVDFGSTTTTRPTPAPWNNISGAAATIMPLNTAVSNLLDTNSQVSSLAVKLTSNNWYVEDNGVSTSATGQIYPASATRDNFRVANPGIGTMEILNCVEGKVYQINILSARQYIGYNTNFTVQGVTKTIMPKNNVSTLLTWTGVVPVGGKITISANNPTASAFVYFNVLEIIETAG